MDWGSLVQQIAQGGLNSQQREQWNTTVGAASPNQFAQQAGQAASQVPPQQYQQHLQSQPVANLPPEQQSSLASTLISTLMSQGMGQQQIKQNTGVQTVDPSKMSPQEIASVLQYVHQTNPQLLGNVAAQYQNQPDVVHSILGNKALLAVAAAVGAGLLTGQIGRKK